MLIAIAITIAARLIAVEAEILLLVEQQKFATSQINGEIASLAVNRLNPASVNALADNVSSLHEDSTTKVVTLQALQNGYYD